MQSSHCFWQKGKLPVSMLPYQAVAILCLRLISHFHLCSPHSLPISQSIIISTLEKNTTVIPPYQILSTYQNLNCNLNKKDTNNNNHKNLLIDLSDKNNSKYSTSEYIIAHNSQERRLLLLSIPFMNEQPETDKYIKVQEVRVIVKKKKKGNLLLQFYLITKLGVQFSYQFLLNSNYLSTLPMQVT
jgi:hypothetical protein